MIVQEIITLITLSKKMNLANSVMMSSQKHLLTNKQKTKENKKTRNTQFSY